MCLCPMCYYPDLIARASRILQRMTEEHSVLGKLNVIWKTMKSLSMEIRDRILVQRCGREGVE